MNDSNPWTEKYRPDKLGDVTGHHEIIRSFRHYIVTREMPNILLSGPAGVGKTALIHSFAKEFFGDYYKQNFREWNTSDERGVDVVRGPIKQEALYGPKGKFPFKFLYLGEMDGMTDKAQDALKRIMETSYRNVRFIADTNNLEAIIAPIQSRFCHFTVRSLPHSLVLERLKVICMNESMAIDEDVLAYIVQSKRGDVRNSIQLLQGLPYDGEDITIETIRGLSPSPDMQKMTKLMGLNFYREDKKWYQNREEMFQECISDDPSCRQSLEMIFNIFELNDFWDAQPENLEKFKKNKWRFMVLAAEYQIRIGQGNPIHQFRCFLEQIYQLRQSI